MFSHWPPLLALLAVVLIAGCDQASRNGVDSAGRRGAAPLAECYRSPSSALGRTTPLDGHSSVAPGWLRFDASTGSDSGAAQLIDADGARFDAGWRRTSVDSIEIRGFDDFMRVELRVLVADSTLRGSGLVTSDADVQRDAAGRLEPLRREWVLNARAAPCGDAPTRSP